MLERIKRKLSRTQSVSEPPNQQSTSRGSLTLTPSDEQLISKLSFAPDTKSVPTPLLQHVDTHQSERTVANNVESGMLALPTEMLLILQKYLRPSSEVALRHTCSRFFYLYKMPSFYLAGDEKFDFVCMTERDQDPTQLERLVCGNCRELHPRYTFPASEVRQPPLERNCRQVWLCGHRYLGYPKTVRSIKAGVEAPFRAEAIDPCTRCRETIRNRFVADRPEKGTSEIDLDSSKAESMLISKIAILQRPSPSYNSRTVGNGSGVYKEVFGVKEVSAALQAIDFRICPHVKLGDPYILSKFCRSCTNTQRLPPGVKGPPCISCWNKEQNHKYPAKCKGVCFDRHCKTKFMFQARESLQPDASGRLQVWLFIVAYRWLGPLQSAGSDANWRGHTVNHEERIQMRKAWDKWEKSDRSTRPMPNWSISLLHPEDCNLR